MAQQKITFGALEQAIMDALWDTDAQTVRSVWTVVSQRRSLAYTTVMTVMNRLTAQGHLRRRRDRGGAYVYSPSKCRATFATDAARLTVNDLIRRYGDAAIVQFLEVVDRIPESKIQALQRKHKTKRP